MDNIIFTNYNAVCLMPMKTGHLIKCKIMWNHLS